MKRILTTIAALTLSLAVAWAQTTFENATDAVKNMTVGWNLGNTLDANNGNRMTDIVQSETLWGQPVTHPELMTMMKEAGFGAIRVPVTWYPHMDATGKVDAAWMTRVHEVVDYVLNAGMYCILNVHHDTGDGSTHWLHASMDIYNQQRERFEYLWKQIAEEFRDYDQRLLFEGYNEMLDKYNSWCFATFNTTNKYIAADAADAYQAINSFAQSFVNAVRATGGNNAQRNLVVNTYAACNGSGTWNSHLKDPLINMAYPSDPATGHIAFQVHTYPNIENMTNAKKEVDQMILDANTYLVAKGAPVIFGEWGTSNVDAGSGLTDYDIRRDAVLAFADYFIKQTKANGMGTFYWMGLSDGAFRTMPKFHQPDLAEAITKAWHGEDFPGVYPSVNDKSSLLIFEGQKALNWGNGIQIEGNMFKSVGSGAMMRLTFNVTGNAPDIQLFYGDWESKPSFCVGNTNYNGDYNPPTDMSQTADFTFTNSVYQTLCQKGLIIHGSDVTVTRVELINPNTSAVHLQQQLSSMQQDQRLYDLNGRFVTSAHQGIYIQGGRKIVRH